MNRILNYIRKRNAKLADLPHDNYAAGLAKGFNFCQKLISKDYTIEVVEYYVMKEFITIYLKEYKDLIDNAYMTSLIEIYQRLQAIDRKTPQKTEG